MLLINILHIKGLGYEEVYDYINRHRNTSIIKFLDKKKENKKMGTNIEHITKHTYGKYDRGGKCVCMFRYTYTGIRLIKILLEKGDRYRSRVVRTSRAP